MITLRPVQAEDAEVLFPLVYRTTVTDTLQWDGPDSLETYCDGIALRAAQVARGEKHLFTIIEQVSVNPIGMTDIRQVEGDFRYDIGLWIGEPYQGRGYGTLVIAQITGYGFERLDLEKIEASVFVGNWASRRIFEKNGFSLEGTIRQAVRKRDRLVDEWLFGITRQEYFQRISNQARPSTSSLLLHLCRRTDWQAALQAGVYQPASLIAEGFIHASRPDQILEVANCFYRAQPDLLLLSIDPQRLNSPLRWELADGAYFPHIYGALNLSAIIGVNDFFPDSDGVFRHLPHVPFGAGI